MVEPALENRQENVFVHFLENATQSRFSASVCGTREKLAGSIASWLVPLHGTVSPTDLLS